MNDYRNSGRQNQLSQWMDFYRRNAGMPNLSGSANAGDIEPIYNRAALDWASQQLQSEDKLGQDDRYMNMFSNRNQYNLPAYSQPQFNQSQDNGAEMQMRNYLSRLMGPK